ncbi:GlxA family transcriptional regulator [Salipiger abyssi]|uniref:Transcriptional regulator n=1 Tax=Salipiger abyssi TaxID=1250539 RepID=A0A1P8UTZ9_9RHOB|nr:GlxA family transcriptional regulator [Salipiger abyssi]APZ52861.1 transcriptional regulator [Salipiger abyssi]
MAARRIGFCLVEGYAMMSTAAAMEPLRAANLFSDRPLYEILPLSVAGGPVRSSLPAAIETRALEAAGSDFDMVFVVAGGEPLRIRDRALYAWLRRMDRLGVTLGGISGGSAVLARAGLMDNRRFTVHWHHLDELRAMSDGFALERRLYVIDRDRYTCAGGTAPLDMMHAMISAEHGAGFARRISDWFIQTEIRVAEAPQQASIAARYGPLPRAVSEALELMESHIADPLELGQIAALVGLSPRQLQRQFAGAVGMSVIRAYRDIRLGTARELLRTSRIRIGEIAQMTGFATQAAFSEAYRQRYDEAPRQARDAGL